MFFYIGRTSIYSLQIRVKHPETSDVHSVSADILVATAVRIDCVKLIMEFEGEDVQISLTYRKKGYYMTLIEKIGSYNNV